MDDSPGGEVKEPRDAENSFAKDREPTRWKRWVTKSLIVSGALISYMFVYRVFYIYLDEYEGKGAVPILPGWVWDVLDWSVEPLVWLGEHTEIYGIILEKILESVF